MAGTKNAWAGLVDALKFLQSGQMIQSVDKLTLSMQNLNREIANLNSVAMAQNNQLSESIKQTKQQAEDLRKELEKLNEVNSKSHGIFERLEKASESADKLNRVVAAFTVIAGAVGMYSILKDVACSLNPSCNYLLMAGASLGSAYILLFGLLWMLKKR